MRPRVTSIGLIALPPPAEDFAYPAHIDRDSLEALPSKPGVYLFRDRRNVPLYIGKSINLRSRVLSHLRTPQEAAMLQATRRVDFLRTAGEIGALLLESHLIKQMQPAYNALLRDFGESFALALSLDEAANAARVAVVGSSELLPEEKAGGWFGVSDVFGLFASRSAAQEGLRLLVRQHGLCPALLGLESTTHGRACFSHQIGRCKGACIGKESARAHRLRLQRALAQLQEQVWPYAGPVGVVEESDGLRQIHIIDRWAYLGSLQGRRKQLRRPARQCIDIDPYKILAGPLRNGALTVVPCQVKHQAVVCAA